MTMDEVFALARRITYKSNWKIRFLPWERRGLQVEFRVCVPSRDGSGMTNIMASIVFSENDVEMMDRAFFLFTVFGKVTSMEEHEAREWFRFDGDLIYDPHSGREIEKADQAAEEKGGM